MTDHPFGIGLGLYQYTYPLYAFPVEGELLDMERSRRRPHNDYLQMGVEMGVGALLGLSDRHVPGRAGTHAGAGRDCCAGREASFSG